MIKIILAAALLFLYSCAGRAPLDSSVTAEKAAELARGNTPSLCGYKGRVSIKAERAGEAVSFNALLDKTCSDSVNAVLLGAFNSVSARIKYFNGDFGVEASDPDFEQSLRAYGAFYADIISRYLKSPLIYPDDSFNIAADRDSYIFSNLNGVKIYADNNFRLYKYIDGSTEALYEWDGETVKTASLSQKSGVVLIRFLSETGWISER